MIRSRRDFDDFDNLFDQDEAKRRRDERAEMIARGAENERQLAAAAAIASQRTAEWMKRSNKQFLLDGYAKAGVRPPTVDCDGFPRCSIHLLRQAGWTIEDVGAGVRELVPPAHLGKKDAP